MKIQLIVAAGFVALATGANAQVINGTNIVTPFADANAKFLSIGENLAAIDGSINVTVGGQNGGTDEAIAVDVATGLFTTLEDSFTATTATFGDMSTTAAGALSTSTLTLTETAAVFDASAEAMTTNTESMASDMTEMGGGIGVSTGAYNAALAMINGSIMVDVDAGNTMIGNLSTTAAGAINTATITANFVGLVQ